MADLTGHDDLAPRRVRAWYGLPGESVIEAGHWHLVKVGPLPLPHPPLVNLLIRRCLPSEDRLRMSYWHEYGHLQTLPLALVHAVWLWRRAGRMGASLPARLARGAALLLVHEAAWELAAETYVLSRDVRTYGRAYRAHPNPLLPVFWIGVASVTVAGTLRLASRRRSGRHDVNQILSR